MHLSNPLSILTLLLLTLTSTILAAPLDLPQNADADSLSARDVPFGATHFARSVPELIAEKKAKEQRALAAKDKERRREMGLW